MAPGLRQFLVVFILGQFVAMWWLSGQYEPAGAPGAEAGKNRSEPFRVWTADEPAGKPWGTDARFDTPGLSGTGTAFRFRLEGADNHAAGLNWKGWSGTDDVSRYRSLTFHIRQRTNVADADLTVRLSDSRKRPERAPAGNGLRVLKDGRVSRLDGDWRKVVLPLDRFAAGTDLDLTRVWGVDFSDSTGRPLEFAVDRITFSDEFPPMAKFPPTAGFSATATVRVDRPGHTIPDTIYGVCDLPADKLSALAIPACRWGGNRSSRYNWQLHADNAGKDWFFKNGGEKFTDPLLGGWFKFGKDQADRRATAYITVPMLGYVSKDTTSYAYSVKKYGRQEATEMGHPDVGNGRRLDGSFITNNDPTDTSLEVTPEVIAEGVRRVARHVGDLGDGPRVWVLDNEPMLWHETHRDVHKSPMTYDELWRRTVAYAEAIRAADPKGKIAGFCSWGWTDLFNSAADKGDDNWRTKPDFLAHNREPLAAWFIRKCGEYKATRGRPLIDIIDVHWYPQAKVQGKTPYEGAGMDPKLNELRLRSTRDLWDPTYKQESWIDEASGGQSTMVLRRVREWIDKHNPGMQLGLGEYNFGGADNITGALAQADVFGLLARERADLAFIWSRPEGSQASAWKLFRNYDGAGGQFGSRWLEAESGHANVAVYASRRPSDGATTIVVLNKDLGGPCDLTLKLPGLEGSAKMWRFDQDTDGQVAEVNGGGQAVRGVLSLKLPAASGSIIVIR